VREEGLGARGTHYAVEDFYDRALEVGPTEEWDGQRYPSLRDAERAADVVLEFASATNGELAHRAYRDLERQVGLPLADLAEGVRDQRTSYADLASQPRRLIASPLWSGLPSRGRPYSPFALNRERSVPWRTLTGRQHLYIDHPDYIGCGEHLPTYKPAPAARRGADLRQSGSDEEALELDYLTPHGKWQINSTYGDSLLMSTLSRGVEPLWLSPEDAARIGVKDNDWLEVHNDHGVVVTRAVVSARIPRGTGVQYHSPERTCSVPKSPSRGGRRGGGPGSLIRARLKPNLMVGGYGQLTYHFDYWGPIGCDRDTRVLVRRLSRLTW